VRGVHILVVYRCWLRRDVGEVIEHQFGWRSEYAAVRSIILLETVTFQASNNCCLICAMCTAAAR
jgi:hypothetical protein